MPGLFTQTIDWLAFTVPNATVEAIQQLVGGDWITVDDGFRGYPMQWIMKQGRQGVGKLGTGAHRNGKEVHVDLSGGIVSTWEEAKVRQVLSWIMSNDGHLTRMDLALDDREATVPVDRVRRAFEAGQAVTRSQKFQSVKSTSNKDGGSRGETLNFGNRQSQTMLRVYDKRLELAQRQDVRASEYVLRWELEFKAERAQACAKALLNLLPEDWRECVVGFLRAYVDFRETTRDAKPYEKYRAPLLAWWATLTEGFKTCRLVVEKVRKGIEDLCQWLGQAVSASLAVAYCRRGEAWLQELIYTGTRESNGCAGSPAHFLSCHEKSRATRLVQAGADIYTVQKLGRWKTISMVMRYAHHHSESLRAGIEILDHIPAGVSTVLAQSANSAVTEAGRESAVSC